MWKGALIAAVLAVCGGAATAATISTIEIVTGEATPWGLPETAIYGQTVTFGTGAAINRVEVRIRDAGTPIRYNFYIYAWNGSSVTGAPLVTRTGQTSGNAIFTTYVIDVGHVALPAGQYVLAVEATSTGTATFATADGSYAGGSWVYFDKQSGLPITDYWYVGTDSDLSFRVVYSPSSN